MPYVSQYVHKYAEHIMKLPDHMGHARVPSLNLDQLPIIKEIHRWASGVALLVLMLLQQQGCMVSIVPMPPAIKPEYSRGFQCRIKPWVEKRGPVQLLPCSAVVLLQ